jgi:hypothetical protein
MNAEWLSTTSLDEVPIYIMQMNVVEEKTQWDKTPIQ